MSTIHSRVSVVGTLLMTWVLLSTGSVQAQSNGDGSIYSRFGLGTLTEFSSSRADALGGGGYALRSLNYSPIGNPALWSDQVYTRLSAGGSFRRVLTTGPNDRRSQLSSGTVEALQFSFPIYSQKLGVAFSYQPYTQHNYRVRRTSTIPVQTGPNAEEDVVSARYRINYRGTGGLHSFRGGLGYRMLDLLSVGASVDVLFGILERNRSTDFSAADLRDVSISDATRLVGVSGTVGSHLTLSNLAYENDSFVLGVALSLPTTLSGTRVRTQGEGNDLSADTLASVDGEVSLPWRGRLGMAYQPNAKWTFTVNGRYEPWSSFTSTFTGRKTFSQPFPLAGAKSLTDRWRVSGGVELVPAGQDGLAGFFANMGYRLGAYTERLYVRPTPESVLRTHAVTGGFSFPTSLSGTRIDLNLEVGTRGTARSALVEDTFYGVGLHVNFGERWFKERKLR